jgi:hypothetical protein
VSAASPLCGPPNGGGFAAAGLAAPAKGTGPPLRPQGCCASRCARRPCGPPLTPETTAAPGSRKSGQATACPRRARAHQGQPRPGHDHHNRSLHGLRGIPFSLGECIPDGRGIRSRRPPWCGSQQQWGSAATAAGVGRAPHRRRAGRPAALRSAAVSLRWGAGSWRWWNTARRAGCDEDGARRDGQAGNPSHAMTISPASTAGKNPIPVSSSTAIEAAERRGVDGLGYVVGDVNAPAAGPRCGGCAHGRFRNLK